MSLVHGLSILLFSIQILSAQSPTFQLLPAGESKPTPRVDGTIVWDAVSRRVILFGGQDNGSRNDLWAYSLDTQRWQQIETSGATPPARFGHTSALDKEGRLIIFGGQSSGFFSDVWAFDFRAGTWKQLAADNAGPSRRYGHSAIYEAGRDRLVISHGFTNAGRFDDTWAFDLRTNSWRDLSPGGTRPLRRCLHHAVHDETRGRMLLYGGCASGFGPCPLGDLWSFDLATQRWSEITASPRPAPRMHYGRVFSSKRDQMLLFGGSGGGLLNDLWSFSAGPTSWEPLAISGDKPTARDRHESAYAPELDAAFFFGGNSGSGYSNELWILRTQAVVELGVRSAVNAFSGAAGPIAPGELVTLYGTFPSATSLTVTVAGLPTRTSYAGSDQINIQVPRSLPVGAEAEIAVGDLRSMRVATRSASPGIYPTAFHRDGTPVSIAQPASLGEVITLYATGVGVANSRIGILAGGIAADPLSAVEMGESGAIKLETIVSGPVLAVVVDGVASPEISLDVK